MSRVTVGTIKSKRQEFEANIDLAVAMAEKYNLLDTAMAWYNAAHSVAVELSIMFGIDLQVVVAVIAILSPMVYWTENLRDTYELLSDNGDYRFRAYGNNVGKAMNALYENKPELADSIKVRNFFLSILRPENNESCTVDIWTLRALADDYESDRSELYKLFNTTGKQSLVIDIISSKATEHNVTPSQLQSIMWAVAQYRAGRDRSSGHHPVDDIWQKYINTIE